MRQLMLSVVTSALLVSAAQAEVCTYRRVIAPFDKTDFSPLVADTSDEISPLLEVNATLFRRGQDGLILPELGKSFKVDYDARKMTVELDPSCGWSDGTPITAHDYVEGLRLLFSPEAKETYIPGRELFKHADRILSGEFPTSALGVRAEGKHKVVFDLMAPPDMLMTISTYVSMTPAPTHLLKDNPKAWPTSSLVRVSSGPFTATEKTDGKIVLARNPHYCAGYESDIQRVELVGEGSISKALALFKAGDIDVVEGLSKQQVDQLLEEKPDAWVDRTADKILLYLFVANGFEQHPDIRKALLWAVDRQSIVEQVLEQDTYVYEHNNLNFKYKGYEEPQYDASFSQAYTSRIEQARAVLAKHGYGPEKRLELTVAFVNHDGQKELAEALKSMLSNIYVDLTLASQSKYEKIFDYDLAMGGWFADFDDPFNTLAAFAQVIEKKEPRFVDEVQKTNLLLNHRERLDRLSALEQQIIDTSYLLPLYMFSMPVVLSDRISLGDELSPLGRDVSKEGCWGGSGSSW